MPTGFQQGSYLVPASQPADMAVVALVASNAFRDVLEVFLVFLQ
jgi:hypothetical protein